MKRFDSGWTNDIVEDDKGEYVRFADVQAMLGECIDPLQVAIFQSVLVEDVEYGKKINELLLRVRLIVGAK